MGSERCRGCHRFVSQRVIGRQIGRLAGMGVPRSRTRTIMPRCDGCVSAWVKAGHILLPQSVIQKEKRPVYAVIVSSEAWEELFNLIQLQSDADFVCVKVASDQGQEAFLVATTAVIPDLNPKRTDELAALVERAIVARPPEASPRYVASNAWGGLTAEKS